MSEHIFKLPDLGEGTVESEIGEWFIKVGEFVEEEAIVGTMMTDKAAVELASPVSGTVTRLAGEPGDMVAVGAALVVFETDGKAATSIVAEEKVEPEAAPEQVAVIAPDASKSSARNTIRSVPTAAFRIDLQLKYTIPKASPRSRLRLSLIEALQ